MNFYDFAKKYENEVFNDQEEEYNLMILKEFANQMAKPTTICNKL
jgi:hypothetical protein